jgi:uncharacterized protein involved in response to NO
VIVAHIMGLPIEETASQLAPVGAVTLTAVAVAGRTWLGRLGRWLRPQPQTAARFVGASLGALVRSVRGSVR